MKTKTWGGGNSNFGRWLKDEHDLPAFEYTCVQENNDRALWESFPGQQSRTHWHQLGNDRVTALAANDGHVVFFFNDTSPQYLNAYEPEKRKFSGGFGWINDGKTSFCTNYLQRPDGCDYRRVFGTGYYLKELAFRNLHLRHVIFCPYGNVPVILSSIRVKNTGSAQKTFQYYEYWDVHPLILPFFIPKRLRKFISRMYRFRVRHEEKSNALVAEPLFRRMNARSFSRPFLFPPCSPYIFLACLNHAPSGFDTDINAFLGSGSLHAPDAVKQGASFQSVPKTTSSLCLILRHELSLKPNEEKELVFAYGYEFTEQAVHQLTETLKQNAETVFDKTIRDWKTFLPKVRIDGEPEVERELVWSAYHLRSATLYDAYVRRHFIPQGGNYLFAGGMNGATRDLCSYALPMIYLDPALAREILCYVLSYMEPDGRLSYDLSCFGKSNVFVLKPSDLSMWLFWAVSEYVLATRDFDFMDEELPFYPLHKGVTGSVFEHLVRAYRYVKEKVGTGKHGVLRVMTNDWNDEIVIISGGIRGTLSTVNRGESTFNQALAAFTLPKLVKLLSAYRDFLKAKSAERKTSHAEEFSSDVETWTLAVHSVLKCQWTGKWFNRGYLGNSQEVGRDAMFLEPQPFALMAEVESDREGAVMSKKQIWTLINEMENLCAKPSPIGAAILSHPKHAPASPPGEMENGGMWYAISGPLVLALSEVEPALAWAEFKKILLATHADRFPDIWYGVWSGPDSYNSFHSARHGETWMARVPLIHHPLLGAKEFPVMNTHSHIWTLYSFMKICGMRLEKEGIRVTAPNVPSRKFYFSTRLFHAERTIADG